MNQSRPVLDRDLDRLADGELSVHEYRQLLALVEEEPGGWRRCALALLEARALQQDLPVLRGELVAAPAHAKPTPGQEHVSRPWKTWLAMAASFLVALPIGHYLLRPPGSAIPPAVSVPETKAEQGVPSAPPSAPRPLGNVQVVTDQGQLEVPYYNAQDGAPYLLDDRGGLPEATIRSLERAGHRVERSPGILPVELDNGSRVYVPFDNYRITPVNHQAIQ